MCHIIIAVPCLPCSLLAPSKKSRCGITSCEAMEDREGDGFLSTQVFVDSIDVMISKVIACTKGDPNIHILAEADKVVELPNDTTTSVSTVRTRQLVQLF